MFFPVIYFRFLDARQRISIILIFIYIYNLFTVKKVSRYLMSLQNNILLIFDVWLWRVDQFHLAKKTMNDISRGYLFHTQKNKGVYIQHYDKKAFWVMTRVYGDWLIKDRKYRWEFIRDRLLAVPRVDLQFIPTKHKKIIFKFPLR